MNSEYPSDEIILASAVQYLIEGQEEDAASLLLSCTLSIVYGSGWAHGDEWVVSADVLVRCPRSSYEVLRDTSNPHTSSIKEALQAVVHHEVYIEKIEPSAHLVELEPGWKAELLEIARGRNVDNLPTYQRGRKIHTWERLRFRSKSELKIAEALERKGVLFFPNGRARLNGRESRVTLEPDFLVSFKGKWGILEVDGAPFHPPQRRTEEQERDRVFRAGGVRVVEHFDATRCYQKPDEVVSEFLKLLENS